MRYAVAVGMPRLNALISKTMALNTLLCVCNSGWWSSGIWVPFIYMTALDWTVSHFPSYPKCHSSVVFVTEVVVFSFPSCGDFIFRSFQNRLAFVS